MVHKSTVGSVAKKVICNDMIVAFKLKAEPESILIFQVYMPTSEYENEVTENCMI
jgi:hypothetical protein